mmetsp:Transcript_10313/g.36018  ORF Transcript_10313/g.36018 Transcript_10313/m.36018 type:complete len:215 (-) Transcript_10313:79-723(-)
MSEASAAHVRRASQDDAASIVHAASGSVARSIAAAVSCGLAASARSLLLARISRRTSSATAGCSSTSASASRASAMRRRSVASTTKTMACALRTACSQSPRCSGRPPTSTAVKETPSPISRRRTVCVDGGGAACTATSGATLLDLSHAAMLCSMDVLPAPSRPRNATLGASTATRAEPRPAASSTSAAAGAPVEQPPPMPAAAGARRRSRRAGQ